ncbi:MAG: hypothetical protein JSS86_24985 [Cyanobacteria bacterium SZAS LIN-2]|nr:hypothetical protein [Cyanobacteria bacterium SZAS LIN-2]
MSFARPLSRAAILLGLIAATAGGALPALAESPVRFLSASPVIDKQPTAPIDAPAAAAPLQGGVMVEDQKEGEGAQEDPGQQQLQSRAQTLLFNFLGRRATMTSDEYRKLNYGVLGIIGQKSLLNRFYTITEVLPECPAALAGIRRGDIEIQASDHVFTRQDDQAAYWHTMCGKAGTPVDIVVKRGEELLTFHLVRMNIEDIRDDRVRRMYERMLSLLGPPGGN